MENSGTRCLFLTQARACRHFFVVELSRWISLSARLVSPFKPNDLVRLMLS